MSALLLGATVLLPLGMLIACAWPGPRARMLGLLWLAPLPGLVAALLHGAPPVTFDAARRFTLALDAPGALLLGGAALLWSLAGLYAARYLRNDPAAPRFAGWWLLTLAGSLGVFFAGDLVSFYLAFAVVSLAAFGLVVHDGTERAQSAAGLYLLLAVVGEACLLLAFALLAAETPGESLAITDVVAALPNAPGRDLIIGLLLAGFGLKAGLVPLHVWLPIAHPAAPMPASAVLSGAIIKAGIIGLIRFLPPELAAWSTVLAVLGFGSAWYAAAIGLTQCNAKTVLAYSSVSQMGLLIAAIGLGAAPRAVAFAALCHMLAKGALFLAVGVAPKSGGAWRWALLVPAAILALGFGGLPGTGGGLAKLALKPALDGTLGFIAAIGSTLLMLNFCRCLAAASAGAETQRPPAGLTLPWLALALAAIAVPWWCFTGEATDAFGLKALLPVLIGSGLALALRGVTLPVVPEGDILVLARRLSAASPAWAGRAAALEAVLRSWPAAGASLIALALGFAVALLG